MAVGQKVMPLSQIKKNINSLRCESCLIDKDLYICLICGYTACGRYINACSKAHWKASKHNYVILCERQYIWDYNTDQFIHRVNIQNEIFLANDVNDAYSQQVKDMADT